MIESPPKVLRRAALLIGVSSRNHGGDTPLTVGPALDRLARALEDQFGFDVSRCEDERATRVGLLERLDTWVADCQRADADVCLLYYFGHGGRVEFTDLELEEREFGYVTCWRVEPPGNDGTRPFEGVLGFELSTRLSVLAERGRERSVVAILDCCHAGQLVRLGRRVQTLSRQTAPLWARALFDGRHEGLAVDSHPEVVRLAGSTPKRESHLDTTARGQIGYLTSALLTTLDELGDDWQRATWDAVARRVRQRVIDAVGEGQWVSFAGPREQLLFSPLSATPLRTAGLAAERDRLHGAWLRVGVLQGVREGDRWAVTSPVVEEGGTPRVLAVGIIDHVELNRSKVVFDENVDVEGLQSNSAQPVSSGKVPFTGTHLLTAISTLADEKGSRHERLPFTWTWGVAGSDRLLPPEGATIFSDERIWFRFHAQTERARHWFVNVILVHEAGVPWQLNTRLPQGLELARGDREQLGLRVGARQQGLRLPVVGPAKLLLLATSLPLELDHLVQLPDRATADAFVMQGLRPTQTPQRTSGRRPPDWLERWAHCIVDLDVRTDPRSS